MLMGTGDSGFALMSMVVVVGMPMLVLVVLGVMFVIVFTSVITRHDQGHVNVSLHVLLQTERVSAKLHQ